MRMCLLAVVVLAVAATGARADEVVVKNDSLTDGAALNICPCFTAGEEAAVWLTSPCDGNIVAIQIFWKSFLGDAQIALEDSIIVYEGGTFPVPGPVKESLPPPALTDGFLNEFRFKDQDQSIPISIPVTAGETFVVSLKFFNANNDDVFKPSVGSDSNGCQPGRNAVKVNGNTWTNACALGVSGDWVIRAVIDCTAAPTGACCLDDGSCASLTEFDCIVANGHWNGAGVDCADVVCLGACYIPSTEECLQFDKATCDLVGGIWQGPGTNECLVTCLADLTGDGVLDFFDVQFFLLAYNAGSLTVDFNSDGVLDFFDVQVFLINFSDGCP